MLTCPKCFALNPEDSVTCSRCGADLLASDESGFSPEQLIAGRYQLIRRIGEGGMGEVWEALQTGINRPVAIKFLHADLMRHTTARRRVLKEAESLGRLAHAHVVTIHDCFETDNTVALVLEYIRTGSLAEQVDSRGAIPWQEAVSWLSGMLKGLGAIHRAGLIHRDIKPDNVLLAIDEDGDAIPKITDLGIAHSQEGERLTRDGSRLGTPEYMPPEQIKGLSVDARSDIYASGVVLYELLVGRLPFEGTDYEIQQGHVQLEPDFSRLPQDLPSHVRHALARSLAKQPEKRFADCRSFRAALKGTEVSSISVAPAQIAAEPPAPKKNLAPMDPDPDETIDVNPDIIDLDESSDTGPISFLEPDATDPLGQEKQALEGTGDAGGSGTVTTVSSQAMQGAVGGNAFVDVIRSLAPLLIVGVSVLVSVLLGLILRRDTLTTYEDRFMLFPTCVLVVWITVSVLLSRREARTRALPNPPKRPSFIAAYGVGLTLLGILGWFSFGIAEEFYFEKFTIRYVWKEDAITLGVGLAISGGCLLLYWVRTLRGRVEPVATDQLGHGNQALAGATNPTSGGTVKTPSNQLSQDAERGDAFVEVIRSLAPLLIVGVSVLVSVMLGGILRRDILTTYEDRFMLFPTCVLAVWITVSVLLSRREARIRALPDPPKRPSFIAAYGVGLTLLGILGWFSFVIAVEFHFKKFTIRYGWKEDAITLGVGLAISGGCLLLYWARKLRGRIDAKAH